MPLPLLPIHEVLPKAMSVLAQGNTLILQAPPGAGKSTLLPLELLNQEWLEGQKILLLEPRRLAARSVAERMASLLGEQVGQTVGYRVRFESKISAQTRLEVITEGILSRLIRADSLLEGVGAVVLDEFHERGLQGDWALALLRQVQSVLRADLRLVVMSATLETKSLQEFLAAPLVESQGRSFPVDIEYLDPNPQERIESQVVGALRLAVSRFDGDVLVFLPGAAEILRTLELLKSQSWTSEISLHTLYGEMPFQQQQAALLPASKRKIILATSIAETSLTIEGVKIVVDSGLARVPVFDLRSGLTKLQTVRVTQDGATQRAGRAGRTAPGHCLRLWNKNLTLEKHRNPEIMEADMAALALEMADWGETDLLWLTPPPASALRAAQDLLQSMGALNSLNQLTEKGKKILALPTHPRLACLLLEAQTRNCTSLGADLAAIIEEKDPLRQSGADISLRLAELVSLRQNQQSLAQKADLLRIERLSLSWRKWFRATYPNENPHQSQTGALLAAAYPDRIAKHLGQGRYKLSNGKIATLLPHDPLTGSELLVAAHLNEEKIFLAAAVESEDLQFLAQNKERVFWDKSTASLKALSEARIGEMVLHAKPLQKIDPKIKVQVLLELVRNEGQSWLPWDESIQNWQNRVLSLRIWNGEYWPNVLTDDLLRNPENWLSRYLEEVNGAQDFKKLPLASILSSILTWQQLRELNELAPETITVPSGSKIALSYDSFGSLPVLAVRLQELFGLRDVPKINAGKTAVLLHLLSPGFRPVQITQDLYSFWLNTYPQVRKELKIRYPKHAWPEDPWHAEPVRGVKKKA